MYIYIYVYIYMYIYIHTNSFFCIMYIIYVDGKLPNKGINPDVSSTYSVAVQVCDY